MSAWDKEYIDQEIPAYILIEKDLGGDFHFGYVQGEIDGRVVKRRDGSYFEFTFDGSDECDPVSGRGWITAQDENNAQGEIRFYDGDDSTFQLKRMEK